MKRMYNTFEEFEQLPELKKPVRIILKNVEMQTGTL